MTRFTSFRKVALAVAALAVLGGLPAVAAHPVPFQGRADLVVTGAEFTSSTTLVLSASATGQATHLGRFTRTETITADLPSGTFTGTVTFTAANGDQLNADVTGHFTSPTLDSAEGTYTFTSASSGRFKNASGQAAFVVKPNGTSLGVTFKGTIQY